MSHIETIMLVVLGFVVAVIVAMVLSRIGWTYAVKLGNRRTERDAPAKIAALQAERDQLRAEYAILSRKLELRLDDLKTRLAEQTAEVSRNRNRLDHMVKEVEKRDKLISEREADVQAIHQHIAPLEQELATRTQANQQLKEQISDRDENIAKLGQQIQGLSSQLDASDMDLASVRNELANAPTVPELSEDAAQTQTKLQQRIADLTNLSREIEHQRGELTAQREEFAAVQQLTATEAKEETSSAPTKKQAKKTKSPAKKQAVAKKKLPAKKAARKTAKAKKLRKAPAKRAPKLTAIETNSRELEGKIESAEQETRDLQAELSRLDDIWTEKLEELHVAAGNRAPLEVLQDDTDTQPSDTGEEPRDGRNFQNVISLAARIRSLQAKPDDK